MYGLLVQLVFEDGYGPEAERRLHDHALPKAKNTAGFLAGTWFRSLDGAQGGSLTLFDTEDSVKAAAEIAAQGPPPGARTRFTSVQVFAVLAQLPETDGGLDAR